MNQFTEQFSVAMLAEKVQAAGSRAGLNVKLDHIENPRIEMESHYFNAKHSKLVDLGLKPHLLTDETLDSMLSVALRYRDNVKADTIMPTVTWAQKK